MNRPLILIIIFYATIVAGCSAFGTYESTVPIIDNTSWHVSTYEGKELEHLNRYTYTHDCGNIIVHGLENESNIISMGPPYLPIIPVFFGSSSDIISAILEVEAKSSEMVIYVKKIALELQDHRLLLPDRAYYSVADSVESNVVLDGPYSIGKEGSRFHLIYRLSKGQREKLTGFKIVFGDFSCGDNAIMIEPLEFQKEKKKTYYMPFGGP